jgi:hypothetical protein
MARNKYTSQIHELEQILMVHHEKELVNIERRLRAPDAAPAEVSPFNEAKARRSTRLAHNRNNGNRRATSSETQK